MGQANDMYNLKHLFTYYIFWLSRVGLGVNAGDKDLISIPHCCVVYKMGRLKRLVFLIRINVNKLVKDGSIKDE